MFDKPKSVLLTSKSQKDLCKFSMTHKHKACVKNVWPCFRIQILSNFCSNIRFCQSIPWVVAEILFEIWFNLLWHGVSWFWMTGHCCQLLFVWHGQQMSLLRRSILGKQRCSKYTVLSNIWQRQLAIQTNLFKKGLDFSSWNN